MSSLPSGWAQAPLTDIIEIFDSRRIPLNKDERQRRQGPYPYYGANGLVDHVDGYLFDGDFVLLAEDGGYFDDPARSVAYEATGRFWVNNHAHILRARGNIPNRFLTHLLNSSNWMPYVSGSTRLKLTQAGMNRVPISLPPLPEIHRLVSKVDALSARTSRVRYKLDRIPKLIERYKQAILTKAFSGELIGNGPSFTTLSAYVSQLDQGWSPKCESFPSASPGKWAVIKTTAIQPMHFLAGENKQLPNHLAPRPSIEVRTGDVITTRAGPRSRVGITCVVRETRPRLMLADKVYRLKIDQNLADPIFVAFMLNAPQAIDLLEQMKTGISDSGLNLTQEKFLNLPLPHISLERQQHITRLLEKAFVWLDKVVHEHARADYLLPKLDQAILAKAFRGELVPQDPSDEPAAKLLEHIRAERAKRPPEKGTRRKA